MKKWIAVIVSGMLGVGVAFGGGVRVEFTETMNRLLKVPAPSGFRSRMTAELQKMIRERGFDSEIDPAGNVLVRIPGKDPKGPTTVLAAHYDEIGMIVTNIAANGDLSVTNLGGLKPPKVGERAVTVLSDRGTDVVGIFSMGSEHGGGQWGGKAGPDWKDVKIITGLTPAQLKAKGIRVGSPAVPVNSERGVYVFGDPENPLMGAWSFDDRAGCAVQMCLLTELKKRNFQPKNPLIVAFTTEEEVGCLGAIALAVRERPARFIAVDGCPVKAVFGTRLSAEPAVWIKDRVAIFDREIIGEFLASAEACGVEVQTGVIAGASDASRVKASGVTAKVALFGHARENSHGLEVAYAAVFENVIRVLTHAVLNY